MINPLLAFVACFFRPLLALDVFTSVNGPTHSYPACDSLSLLGNPFTFELLTDLVLVAAGVPLKVFSLLGSFGNVLDLKCFKTLGSGSYGTVYSAVMSAGTGIKDIALKVSPVLMHGKLDLAFKREVDALKAIHHPNVAQYVDHATDADQNYLVLHLYPGGSLSDLLKPKVRGQRANVLELSYALFVTQQLVAAVCAVHKAGYVHMDIKPANVLLRTTNPRDGVVLCDFGLSQRVGSAEARYWAGTSGYAAPEAYDLEDGKVPSRGGYPMDWYSVAWVLYAMLAGETLPSVYKGRHEDLKKATVSGEVRNVFSRPGWANVPEEVKLFVLNLTRLNPLERLSDKSIKLWIDRLCKLYPVDWTACPSTVRQPVTVCTSDRSECCDPGRTAEGSTTSSVSGFQSALSTSSASDFLSALSPLSVSAFLTASTSPSQSDTPAPTSSSSAPSVWETAPTADLAPAPAPASDSAIRSLKRKARFKAWVRKVKDKAKFKLKRDTG